MNELCYFPDTLAFLARSGAVELTNYWGNTIQIKTWFVTIVLQYDPMTGIFCQSGVMT